MDPSSLISLVRRYMGGGQAPEPGVLRRALAGRLADSRNRRGIRHQLAAVVSVLVAGAACGHRSPLAIAEAAEGWDQELLAAHGCRDQPGDGAAGGAVGADAVPGPAGPGRGRVRGRADRGAGGRGAGPAGHGRGCGEEEG